MESTSRGAADGTSAPREPRRAPCPRCGAAVEVRGRPLVGEPVHCAACSTHLEVAEPEPLRLELYHRIDDEEDPEG